jgi:hypothetical protein
MFKLKNIGLTSLVLVNLVVSGQNIGINTSGANPDNAAMLDIVSTNKGLLIPRVALSATNSNAPITSPVTSLLVYNTVTASSGATEVIPGYYYWTGSEWTRINNGGAAGWGLTGNSNTNQFINFVGTTDNINLSFRTNNVTKLVITTKGQLVPTNTGNSVLIGNNAGNSDDLSSNNNIFIGNNANTIGTNNENSIAIGSSSTFNANNSVVVGSSSVNQGANTTSIGYSADSRSENATAIGYSSYASAVGATAIGYTANSQGVDALSIGKSSYTNALNSVAIGVSANAQSINGISFGASSYTGNGSYNSAFGSSAQAQGGNSTALGYQAGIYAANSVRIGNGSVTTIGGYANWSNVSDERFKRDITEATLGLDFINRLEPVTYYLDVDSIYKFNQIDTDELDEESINSIKKKEAVLQYGFIAQDVHKISDEMGADFSGVDIPQNDQSHYGLRYAEFVVPLVKAVQEQQVMIELLKKEIELLKSQEK